MRLLTEKSCHRLFEWGVWLKTIIAISEVVLGILLYAVSTATLNAIIIFFLRGFENVSGGTQSFWAFIFLTHGLVKLFLLAGLLKNKLWAYPASAVVFALLAIYQIYTLTFGPDILLEIITALDVAVIVLILHEYKHRRIRNLT
jgi:uncharacterized membrane protein